MDHQLNSDEGTRVRTVDEVVVWNIAWFRRAAGLTQGQLAQLVGWTKPNMSALEGSADGPRTRRVDASMVAAFADALGVPLVALFLPPDDGTLVDIRGRADEGTSLMRLVMPDSEDETPAAHAYRDRFNGAAMRAFADDPEWARLVARWVGGSSKARADRAQRLKEGRDALIELTSTMNELIAAMETG